MNSSASFIGKTINRWTILEIVKTKERSTVFRCLCSCGTVKLTRARHVINGTSKSCGCYSKEGKFHRKPKGHAGLTTVWIGYKRNATTKNIEFSLTKDEFKHLVQQNCYYCNIPPSNSAAPYAKSYKKTQISDESREHARFVYNGIDRVDNSKGYIIDNCVSCCKMCNFGKNKNSQEQFISWIKKTYNNLRTKNVIA